MILVMFALPNSKDSAQNYYCLTSESVEIREAERVKKTAPK